MGGTSGRSHWETMDIEVKIKILREGAVLPQYATSGSAGVDLQACLDSDETILLEPGEVAKIPTGLALELPHPEVVALVMARSGLAAKYGLDLANGVGVIDSDYRGELQVLVRNLGRMPFEIHHGDRIAQMLFMPVVQARLEIAEDLSNTERGRGGFGSTGM